MEKDALQKTLILNLIDHEKYSKQFLMKRF